MPDSSTSLGGPARDFPSTRWSLVLAARDAADADRRRCLDELIRVYWKPVYGFIRRAWRREREDAKDLTQAFFADLLERPFIEGASREGGRFRTYLRSCLRNFLSNDHDARKALKRGGGTPPIPLDFIRGDETEPENGPSPEELFDRDWSRAVLAEAVNRLRALYDKEGRPAYFAVFEKTVDADTISYEKIAADTGLSRSDVSNYLLHARARFREIVRDLVEGSVDPGEDWQSEFARLFGAP